MEAAWDQEWDHNLLDAAINRVKRKVDPKHYQMFDLYTFKQWPVSRVARALNVSAGSVYLVKHRISKMVKKELAQLYARPVG